MEEQKIKEIIEEIPQYKVNKIANEIAIRITNVFTELKDQYDELLKKLEQCQIKIAKFEDENMSHYYSNGVIYFSNKIHTNSINEVLVMEYLHFLQDGREQTCFQESLNNFAAKLLTQELKERMNIFGIFLSSLIEGDYALLVNLIMQIDFLVGRKEFVETVINNNDDYYVLINKISNGNIERLTGDFKKLYYLILDYKTTDDLYKVEQEIREMYFSIQNYIMKFYFYYMPIHITSEEEIKEVKQKLEELKNYRGVVEEDKFYEEGYQKIVESLNKKEKQLKKKNSKNALAIIYKNRLIAFIKKLLSFNN